MISPAASSGVCFSLVRFAPQRNCRLDEPVTGLDPVMTNEMYQLIRRINREQNVTIIMVSHDIRNILPDATHILQLDQKQVFFGPMDEYLKTEAGKQFLGGADL